MLRNQKGPRFPVRQEVIRLVRRNIRIISVLGRFIPNSKMHIKALGSYMSPLDNPQLGQSVITAANNEAKRAFALIEVGKANVRADVSPAHDYWLETNVAEQYKSTDVYCQVVKWLAGPLLRDDFYRWLNERHILKFKLEAPWGRCPDCQKKLVPQLTEGGSLLAPEICGACKRKRNLATQKQEVTDGKEELEAEIRNFIFRHSLDKSNSPIDDPSLEVV